MGTHSADLIVIGTGPGGEGAAMKAVKSGKSVIVVDRYHRMGGGCTHWGTIPSKALRQAIQYLHDFKSNPISKDIAHKLNMGYPELLNTANSVIDKQSNMRRSFYEKNDIEIIHSNAKFIDENHIEVTNAEGQVQKLTAKSFVIATGSTPHHPSKIDFSHPRLLDSNSVLQLNTTPKSITIYGAGVVGCEYASIFRNLDVKVNLVNTRSKLLSFLDDEITDALCYHLRDQGVLIRNNECYEEVETQDDGIVLHLKSGKKLKSDYLLWASGRDGNVKNLGLENLNIKPNERGNIPVNENYQTSVPHVYAVGDVVGYPSLASASYDQGRFAAAHSIDGVCDEQLVKDIPTGIYTLPAISSIGRTEQELTSLEIPYEIGHSTFRSLARAQISGSTVGMLKILFHRETLEILGIHCFGDQATEIIHIGQAIMSQKGSANTLMYFINTTFNYPTMAEAYRVAALNGLNRIF